MSLNPRATSSYYILYRLQVQIHELRVEIHELRVQIHELRVETHELWVQIHELQVQFHSSVLFQFQFILPSYFSSWETWKHLLKEDFIGGGYNNVINVR